MTQNNINHPASFQSLFFPDNITNLVPPNGLTAVIWTDRLAAAISSELSGAFLESTRINLQP